MLKISPLFSGSKGNCTLIQSDNTNILIDVGLGYRAILKALESRALAPNDISAIVITHEHSDHIGALQHWAQHFSTDIYAPSPIARELGLRLAYAPVEVVEVDGSFTVGNVLIDVYECSHDVRCCLGYRFTSGDSSFACVTDTGCVTDRLIEFLSPCSAIMLESNHDVDMLLKGDYSYPLKRRILSDYGHLSNAQATEVLSRLIGTTPMHVILAHLSEKNNTRELAFSSAVNMYTGRGITEGKDVHVYVADQYNNDIIICLE